MTEKRMSFFDHLAELRSRIRVSMIAFLLVFFATFFFSTQILNFLWSAFLGQYESPEFRVELLATSVVSGFLTQLNLSFIVAAALSMPVFLYEMFLFVEPALNKKYKQTALKIMLSSIALFVIGVLFIYFVMLPLILDFFIRSNNALGVANFFSVESFFSFVILNLFIGGVIFQTPLVVVTLNRLGILPKEWLINSRRLVYIIILIIAGIVTPDSSIISQLVLGSVMMILFEISLLLSK